MAGGGAECHRRRQRACWTCYPASLAVACFVHAFLFGMAVEDYEFGEEWAFSSGSLLGRVQRGKRSKPS